MMRVFLTDMRLFVSDAWRAFLFVFFCVVFVALFVLGAAAWAKYAAGACMFVSGLTLAFGPGSSDGSDGCEGSGSGFDGGGGGGE